jgi:hypothetical protein
MVRQTSSPLISGKLTSSRSSCGFISPIRRRLSAPVGSLHHSITGAAQDPALGIAAGVIDVENDKGQRFSHEGTCTQIGQLCCSPPFQPLPLASGFCFQTRRACRSAGCIAAATKSSTAFAERSTLFITAHACPSSCRRCCALRSAEVTTATGILRVAGSALR